MQNLQQNEIMYINNEMNLLQDLLNKNEKLQNQFQNGLVRIGKIQVKKRTKNKSFFKPEKYKI